MSPGSVRKEKMPGVGTGRHVAMVDAAPEEEKVAESLLGGRLVKVTEVEGRGQECS